MWKPASELCPGNICRQKIKIELKVATVFVHSSTKGTHAIILKLGGLDLQVSQILQGREKNMTGATQL